MAIQPALAGRLIITWPAAQPAGVLTNQLVRIEDADSGEPILTALKLALILGTDTGYLPGIIEAEITALTDEDGRIQAGSGVQPVPTEEYMRHRAAASGLTEPAREALEDAFTGPEMRTGVFRYAVAEMRIADAASVAGSVETEYDLATGARRPEPEA